MILADKIIELRKKAGMSQEDLANKLDVSRQSVSKWEGALSIPDIDKIIAMSQIFGVSTDYLLKDEIESTGNNEKIEVDRESKKRKVSLEEANKYINVVYNTKRKISLGVLLCILSPVTLLILAQFSELGYIGEELAYGIGITTLLSFVALAVALFIPAGIKLNRYEYLEKEEIETEYGVSGLVKEMKKNYQDKYNNRVIIGVTLCILSVIPLLVLSFIKDGIYSVYGVSVLLFIVSIAVYILTKNGMTMGAYNKLLQESDYAVEKKKENKKTSGLASAYWLIVTAVYLLWSFITNDWHITWIVWVVACILFPVLISISSMLEKKNK